MPAERQPPGCHLHHEGSYVDRALYGRELIIRLFPLLWQQGVGAGRMNPSGSGSGGDSATRDETCSSSTMPICTGQRILSMKDERPQRVARRTNDVLMAIQLVFAERWKPDRCVFMHFLSPQHRRPQIAGPIAGKDKTPGSSQKTAPPKWSL